MKAKLLFALVLLATLGMTSCKKDKEEEPTSVKIGNKDYGIVKIGAQSWTTENYSGEGGVYYDPTSPKTAYGKLYTLAEAKAIALPAGWRIPTKEDFKKLAEAQGAQFEDNSSDDADAIKKLMSKSGWLASPGTNASGFNAFPTGYTWNDEPEIEGLLSAFWTSSVLNNEPYIFEIYQEAPGEIYADYWSEGSLENRRYPIRFVKDK